MIPNDAFFSSLGKVATGWPEKDYEQARCRGCEGVLEFIHPVYSDALIQCVLDEVKGLTRDAPHFYVVAGHLMGLLIYTKKHHAELDASPLKDALRVVQSLCDTPDDRFCRLGEFYVAKGSDMDDCIIALEDAESEVSACVDDPIVLQIVASAEACTDTSTAYALHAAFGRMSALDYSFAVNSSWSDADRSIWPKLEEERTRVRALISQIPPRACGCGRPHLEV